MAIPEVDVAVLAGRRPIGAPEVLRKDAGGRNAADDVRGEVPVQDAESVLRRHRERRARRDRLLSEPVVEGARDLTLAVEAHRALLEAAHHQHRAQQPRAIAERQMLG